MLQRVDYSVIVPVPPVLAFRAFCDLKRLLNRDIYSEATWIQGAPWREGSRLRYKVMKPMETSITAVVTTCDPPYAVSVLNHGLGITADQHVTFRATSAMSTTVRMVVEALGTSREIPEAEVQQAIEFLAHDALDSIVPACEQLAKQAAGPGS